jgi:hypothetical protein
MKCILCGAETGNDNSVCYKCTKDYEIQQTGAMNQNGAIPPNGMYANTGNNNKKKGNGKWVILGIVIVVVFYALISLASGDDSESGKETATKTEESSNKTKNKTSKKKTTKKKTTEKKEETVKEETIKKKKIYNKNKVSIYVNGYDSSSHTLKFKIVNKSKLNLGFNAHAYSVNGIMTNNNMYDMDYDVAKGKKANTELEIDESFLSENDISEIKYIDILFWAYDNDKWFKSFDTGVIRLKTSLYDGDIKYNSKDAIYKKNGVSVEYAGEEDGDYKFIINNNTGNYFDTDVENLSINDYTSSELDVDLNSIIVFNKSRTEITISPSETFLSDNGIKKIKKIEFSLEIRPKEDGFKSWKTKTIKVKTN